MSSSSSSSSSSSTAFWTMLNKLKKWYRAASLRKVCALWETWRHFWHFLPANCCPPKIVKSICNAYDACGAWMGVDKFQSYLSLSWLLLCTMGNGDDSLMIPKWGPGQDRSWQLSLVASFDKVRSSPSQVKTNPKLLIVFGQNYRTKQKRKCLENTSFIVCAFCAKSFSKMRKGSHGLTIHVFFFSSPSSRKNQELSHLLKWIGFSEIKELRGREIFEETLPKALRTQSLTALTSNFGLLGLVQYAW